MLGVSLISTVSQEIYKLYAHGTKPRPLVAAFSPVTLLVMPQPKNRPQIFTLSLTAFIYAFSVYCMIAAWGMILIFKTKALLVIWGIKAMMGHSAADTVCFAHSTHIRAAFPQGMVPLFITVYYICGFWMSEVILSVTESRSPQTGLLIETCPQKHMFCLSCLCLCICRCIWNFVGTKCPQDNGKHHPQKPTQNRALKALMLDETVNFSYQG